MDQTNKNVSIGFIDKKVPRGTHICLVYTEEKERLESMLKFLLSGLISGERAICFSDNLEEDTLIEFFHENKISYNEYKQNNAISLSNIGEVYFQDGIFDPDRMLKNLTNFYNESNRLHFNGCRVIGEMPSKVQQIPGGNRLLEYESRVSLLLRDYPITAICQYNANDFEGAAIMDILKVHPQLIVNGSLVQNPFYMQPEKFLEID